MCSEDDLYREWLTTTDRLDEVVRQLQQTHASPSNRRPTPLTNAASSPEALIEVLDGPGLGIGGPLAEAGFTLKKIIDEMKWRGLTTRYYSKAVNGRNYVILKGSRDLRSTLKGTRYLTSNPKVVRIGITPKTMGSAVKGNSVLLVLTIGVNIAKYIVNDDATLGDLFAETATDLTKGAIAGVLGMLATNALIAAGTAVAAPVVAGLAIAIVVGYGLNALDEHFGITEELAKVIDQQLEQAGNWWDTQLDNFNYEFGRMYERLEYELIWKNVPPMYHPWR